jgi:hypothetical protein
MDKFVQISRMVGLHPLVGFGMLVVDWMLFAGEGGSGGVSWILSVAVAIGLAVPSILIQKFGFKEHWGLAVGKGLIVGLITAIPTAIPSVVSFAGGALGTASMVIPALQGKGEQKALEKGENSDEQAG